MKQVTSLATVSIKNIAPNPNRGLDLYPWIEPKIEQLVRSIKDVGLWEGVIVREAGNGYELAFGHHRIEAAKRAGLTKVSVIVRDLSDEDMLKFMGRENGEDYSTEFLVMLNTWEAAVKFRRGGKKLQAVDIARLLGWMRSDGLKMNNTASACAAGHELIERGDFTRKDYAGLCVRDAKDIAERTVVRIEQIERLAKQSGRSAKDVQTATAHVIKGAKVTIRDVKSGGVKPKDIRGAVDVNAFKSAQTSRAKNNPLFAVFGNAVADQIERMVSSDAAADKLEDIAKAVDLITRYDDAAALRRIDFALGELGKRAANWQKRLTPSRSKLVSITRLLERKE